MHCTMCTLETGFVTEVFEYLNSKLTELDWLDIDTEGMGTLLGFAEVIANYISP